MIYAVERYMDVLKVKNEEETVPGFGGTREPKYHYFKSEADARAFIRKRAEEARDKAKRELARAEARLKRCNKKFSWRLTDSPMAFLLASPSGR